MCAKNLSIILELKSEQLYGNSATKYFGLMTILLAAQVKYLKKSLRSIFRIKVKGNVRRVDTRLKACGFTADFSKYGRASQYYRYYKTLA